jgi:hypothetical protein
MFDIRPSTPDVEEAKSWLRRIGQTRPRALLARQAAVILSEGDELPVSGGWVPSSRFGALSLSAAADAPAPAILEWLGTGKTFVPVWMIEIPRGHSVQEAVDSLRRVAPQTPRPAISRLFLLADGTDLEPLPREISQIASVISSSNSLDDAMEEALRYLKLPT